MLKREHILGKWFSNVPKKCSMFTFIFPCNVPSVALFRNNKSNNSSPLSSIINVHITFRERTCFSNAFARIRAIWKWWYKGIFFDYRNFLLNRVNLFVDSTLEDIIPVNTYLKYTFRSLCLVLKLALHFHIHWFRSLAYSQSQKKSQRFSLQ